MTRTDAILEAAKTHDCFYLYDEAGILAQCRALREAFPETELLYSIKANPHPQVLRAIFSQGFGADAASMGEVTIARQAGLAAENIYYSAPGKTTRDLKAAIGSAHLIADSLHEIRRIEEIAAENGQPVEIGLRINPDFSFTGETGLASKFGVDEEQAISFLRQFHSPFVSVTGFHVHLRSQERSAAVLARYHKRLLTLAARFITEAWVNLSYVNLGSGIGISYAKEDEPVDLAFLGAETGKAIRAFHRELPDVRVLLETGRFLTGANGVYVTTVLDRKISHGKTFVILKNTLNGFLRPSLACLLERTAKGEAMSAEPLYTGKNAFPISVPGKCAEAETETVTLAGNLCTAADVIAENIELPKLSCGDTIAISNAGAYAASLSPMQFSHQEQPTELFLRADGTLAET